MRVCPAENPVLCVVTTEPVTAWEQPAHVLQNRFRYLCSCATCKMGTNSGGSSRTESRTAPCHVPKKTPHPSRTFSKTFWDSCESTLRRSLPERDEPRIQPRPQTLVATSSKVLVTNSVSTPQDVSPHSGSSSGANVTGSLPVHLQHESGRDPFPVVWSYITPAHLSPPLPTQASYLPCVNCHEVRSRWKRKDLVHAIFVAVLIQVVNSQEGAVGSHLQHRPGYDPRPLPVLQTRLLAHCKF